MLCQTSFDETENINFYSFSVIKTVFIFLQDMLVCALTLYSQPVSWLEGIAPIWVQNEVSCCTLSCKLHILKHIRVTIFVFINNSHLKILCELEKKAN